MRTEQLKLDEQVAYALDLSFLEYCQMQSGLSSMYTTTDIYEINSERRRKLGNEVIESINTQVFGGRLALAALMEFGIHSPQWDWDGFDEQPRRYEASDFLYHGTPENIGRKLEVKQPYWQDSNGRKFKHGAPAICTSDKPDIPIMRSLLHENADTFKDKPFHLRLGTDARGKRHWFTLQENIDALQESDATGCLYVIKKRDDPDYKEPYFDTVRGRYLDEYRIHHNRTASIAIKMTVEDLPPDLLVVDAPKAEAIRMLNHLHTYRTPLELGDRHGVAIEPFGGSWDLDIFPDIHNR